MPRGGKRKGAGRKWGTKEKNSKQARAIAAAAEKPLEVDFLRLPDSPMADVSSHLNRRQKKSLKKRNQEWVAREAHDYVLGLLARARTAGDIRSEIVIIKDLMDRAEGTPRPEIEPTAFDLGTMIAEVAYSVKTPGETPRLSDAALADRPRLPAAPVPILLPQIGSEARSQARPMPDTPSVPASPTPVSEYPFEPLPPPDPNDAEGTAAYVAEMLRRAPIEKVARLEEKLAAELAELDRQHAQPIPLPAPRQGPVEVIPLRSLLPKW